MAYQRLTRTAFQALYPTFPTLTDDVYAAYAAKAEGRVGDSYGDEQQDATELLTAHLMTLSGVGGTAGIGAIGTLGATSFKSGTFSATLSESVVAAKAKGGYGATSYGQQFADIQHRLFSGPRLVGCPVHPSC